jgi:hypothetical protein
MKYIISESKLQNFIINYLEKLFPVEDINWTYAEIFDENDMDYYEDESAIAYYFGDRIDGENVFRWYDCGYFGSNAQSVCPLVVVETIYEKQLNSLFNDEWKEPFKLWFIEKFNNPVKYVD